MSSMDQQRTGSFEAFKEHFIGDPWSKPQSGVVRALLQGLAEPDCPAGAYVDYRRLTMSPLEQLAWPRLTGIDGSKLPGFRRTWRYAACLALDGVAELEDAYGEASVLHGVVRVSRQGYAEAGLLPEGVKFGIHEPNGPDDEFGGDLARRLLLYRTGPSGTTEVAAPAVFVPDHGKLYTPRQTFVLQEHVDIRPGTSWTRVFGAPVV